MHPSIPISEGSLACGELGLHITARDGASRYSVNELMLEEDGEAMRATSHPALPLPGRSPGLLSSSLVFPTAGVLRGARCGSKSKGGEGLGEGVAEMLGCRGMGRRLQRVQGDTRPMGQLLDL